MTERIIDLRSDTVTRPTPEMRRAMAEAVVGDDVYGEDPTVNALEQEAAQLLGKEAALYVPSGTMGNQIAILAHTARGDEVLVDDQAHIYYYEVGAPAVLAAVQLRPVTGLCSEEGSERLREALRPANLHFPTTRLVCLENTHNRRGGMALSLPVMREIYQVARVSGLAVHLDGARIFNAALALGCQAADLAACCDSVMFCVSKGLGAPVGSLLCGSREFITRARKYRKLLGGGMRQAGVLAAAARVALADRQRLIEDHAHARYLAEQLADMPGLALAQTRVDSNIVVVDVSGLGLTADDFAVRLAGRGVLVSVFGPALVRLVTHRDVSRQDIEKSLEVVQEVCAAAKTGIL
ncbi:MAG: low-specificity L-threonine aldolase [Bacillota bacterium]